MTRINLVEVEDLADQHLFAEWREIARIPTAATKAYNAYCGINFSENSSFEYVFGTGHVRFFYNKIAFIKERYDRLTEELLKRNFNITIRDSSIFDNVPYPLVRYPWTPSRKEIELSINRISSKLNEKPNWYRYYGEIKSPSFFIDRYNAQLLIDIIAPLP